MGSPDGTKIALGLLASTSALIISYLLVKKYALPYPSKSKREEEEGSSKTSVEEEPNIVPHQSTATEVTPHNVQEPGLDKEERKEDKEKTAEAKDNEKGQADTSGGAHGNEGQNQTSFIVLPAESEVAEENGLRKSDRSSDESSYDVIEDDRMADTVEEDVGDDDNGDKKDDRADEFASAKESHSDPREQLESSLERSLVMVEQEEPSGQRLGESFYASADESFSPGRVEGESESAPTGEDDTTVVYKPDTMDSESKELTSSGNAEVSGSAEEGDKARSSSITEAVAEAELRAASSAVEEGSDREQKPEEELDLSAVTEMLSKCQNSPMKVSAGDIALLVKLLRKNIPELHSTVLNCIVRIAAFNQNTTTLRESGCPEEIVVQLRQTCAAVQSGKAGAEAGLTPLSQVLTNLSLDPKAHPKLEESISLLIDLLLMDLTSDAMTLTALRPLVNLSGEAVYHFHYERAVPGLLSLLESGSHMARVQALRVLVNLSLDEAMLPHLLSAQVPASFQSLLAAPAQTDVILRMVTFLANIFTAMNKAGAGFHSPSSSSQEGESLYQAITEPDHVVSLRSKVFRLTRHDDEDICCQATRLYQAIPETVA